MNKRKMLSAIDDVKRATMIAVRDMSIDDKVTFYQELSDWATSQEQIYGFHPNLSQ